MDLIKTEYIQDMAHADKPKKTQLGTLRDVYVVSLLENHDERNGKFYYGDATKSIKVRVEDKVGMQREDKKAKAAVQSILDTWQEVSLKQMYKPGDKRYVMIDKGEFETNSKYNRVETMLEKNELIIWSSDRPMDYYLYCERGLIEGVFIKVDVSSCLTQGQNHFRQHQHRRKTKERLHPNR